MFCPLLVTWVIDARLAYRDSALHEPGLMNPADPDFHGAMLAAANNTKTKDAA